MSGAAVRVRTQPAAPARPTPRQPGASSPRARPGPVAPVSSRGRAQAADAAHRSRRPAFVLCVAGLLATGLTALLLLHTWAAEDGFHLAALQHRNAELSTTAQSLAAHNQRLESPARLRAAASALGMRPAGNPRFVQTHGQLVAKATAVPPPVVSATPTTARSAATGAHSRTASSSATPATASPGARRTSAGTHTSGRRTVQHPARSTGPGAHHQTKLPPAAAGHHGRG